MPYRLNVDLWHPVNPEDQKVHRLSRGDEVPEWALPKGDELEAVTTNARYPMFLRDEEPTPRATTATPAAEAASEARSESPQQARDKK